ncbi:hypothetical protein C8D92_105217 [Tamilnaduibacter salinus]|uniref:NolW-like domain-containing protein n=1 Tax=Tamilnaduibacter salinus TaxID=1484056 RepID=A0A2U1CX03_9GAMM|nr:secretin N-terminal domain-containing protein [Tamilnaduibacter salinus]PVY76464.1 hypothetical protein C8D92_105217 [Tamilnaduibacter salinus]
MPRILTLLLLLVSGVAFAAPELQTHTLQNRPASDVAEQLRQLYPDDAMTATAQGQSLVIRAEPSVQQEIDTLLETIDVAPRQLRVTVRSGTSTDQQRTSGGVSISDGEVRVGAESKVTTTRRNRERTLVVQEGQYAHITSGQVRTLPVAIQGGRNPAAILDQVAIRSGFLVSARVLSDEQVALTIYAFDNVQSDEVPDGYETEAVMTKRRAAPGDWVMLGQRQTTQSGSQTGIVRKTTGSERDTGSVRVRVEVM